jgi:hypothetical protein
MSCTPITLVGIGLDCGSNVGGLSALYIVDIQDVASVGIAGSEVTGITMASGKTFKSFKFRKGNASLTSAGTRSDENGTLFYTTTIEAKFNKMETAKRTDLAAIAAGNTLVIAKDQNGLYWLVGYSALDTYVFGSASAASGAAMADANQYTLTLTSDTPELPMQVAVAFNISSIVA